MSYLLISFFEIFSTSFSNVLVNFYVEVNNNNQRQCSHKYQTCPIGNSRIGDISSIAKWNINFINSNRATLDLYYDDKKKSADLRVSIQKNKDFYANGKWRNQTSQGGRFIRLVVALVGC